jgi:hypothetical protein
VGRGRRPALAGLGRGTSFVLLALLTITTSPSTARAQELSPEDHERAVQLFVEGRKLLEAGRCVEAIPVLRESVATQPSVGARLSLAECFEGKGALADAYNQLRAAEQIADRVGDAERRDFAHAAVARVEPRVATIRMTLPTSSDIEVRIDDVSVPAVDQGLLASRYALGPGVRHRIEVRAPGKAPWRWETVGLRAGDAPVALSVAFVAELASTPTAPGLVQEGGSGGTRRSVAWVTLGAGAAGVIVGAVAGVVALMELSSLKQDCQANGGTYPSRCSPGVMSTLVRAIAM